MTDLLLKLFVKNRKNTDDPGVRENCGKMASLVGIILNVLLAAGKITVGVLFGAIAVLADGLNNLTDCGSNVVALISFKVAGKPADKEHPYGHARIEYIAAMAVAFIVLVLAFELGTEAVSKIITPEQSEFSLLLVIVMGVSVLVKLWMFFFNRKLGKLYRSEVLRATATDSITDVIATSAVLAAVIISKYTGVNLDGYMGVAVAVIIAVAGIGMLRDTMSELLGKAPDAVLVTEIKQRIMRYDGVKGMHDLTVHNYGPNRYYASVHVEVDAEVPVLESHDLTDRIERDFAENTDVVLVVHMDPIVLDDPELNKFRREVENIVTAIDGSFTVHDFRMVRGVTHTNLIFDVAVPFETKLTSKEIRDAIDKQVKQMDTNLFTVITVEKQLS